ncbi:MAG: hypothetical protein PVJ67_01500 [Candidatus Pacearchaeota archaeon]|jgi:hypothetical protein
MELKDNQVLLIKNILIYRNFFKRMLPRKDSPFYFCKSPLSGMISTRHPLNDLFYLGEMFGGKLKDEKIELIEPRDLEIVLSGDIEYNGSLLSNDKKEFRHIISSGISFREQRNFLRGYEAFYDQQFQNFKRKK